jgi:hypothetical protein
MKQQNLWNQSHLQNSLQKQHETTKVREYEYLIQDREFTNKKKINL